jgi:hypothetical protein
MNRIVIIGNGFDLAQGLKNKQSMRKKIVEFDEMDVLGELKD